jgi:hypothetical protein
MSVVVAMLVVIAHNATVVFAMQRMVDVREVVPGHETLCIDPDLASKLTIAALLSDVVRIIDYFSISHDQHYHV